jgi:tetratricopeptide (TPR) repeat protein
MLDVELFGLDAAAHRRTSALLHALAAALFYLAFRSMTRAPGASLLAVALFALHPLRVESVAWVAERKDVLAGCLAGAVLLAYAGYARRPSLGRMSAVLLFMALGLAAKPSLVPLPLGLLLLDRWPLARTEPTAQLIREKVPLALLALASALLTFLAQRASGTMDELARISLAARLGAAARAIGAYVADLVWPSGLAFFYPHPALIRSTADLLAPTAAALAGVVGASALALRWRRSRPWLAFGWCWFLVFLLPVLGLVPVGAHARADRYTYLPSLGLSVALVWSVRALTSGRPTARRVAAGAGCLWLGALALLTVEQQRLWASTALVTRHALEVTRDNYLAHTNLAGALEDEGDAEGALEHYLAALEIRPGVAPVHLRAAVLYRARGELEPAAEHYAAVVAAEPDYLPARRELGLLLAWLGREREALPHLRFAWRSERTTPEQRRAVGAVLAWVLATSPDPEARDGAEALRVAEACLELGRTPDLLECAAAAAAELGRFDRALEWERQALELLPEASRGAARERLELYRAERPYRRPPP